MQAPSPKGLCRIGSRPVNSTRPPGILGTATDIPHDAGELVLDTERRVLLRLCRVADGDGEGSANRGLADPANCLPSRSSHPFHPSLAHRAPTWGVTKRVTFNVRLPGLDAG